MSEKTIPVLIESIFGAKTKKGLVRLQIGEFSITLEPHKSREIGIMLIEASEAAITDHFLSEWLKNIGVPESEIVNAIQDFRKFREHLRIVSIDDVTVKKEFRFGD